MSTPIRVLVTGATGLLGSSAVRHLLDSGMADPRAPRPAPRGPVEVVALVRDARRARDLLPADDRLRLVQGDVTRPDTVRPALDGVDAVLHTAAYFREYYAPGADADLLHRTNVRAVVDLLEAADRAGVAAVVHTSTIGVLAAPPGGGLLDEDSPAGPAVQANGYRASKLAAEVAVAAALPGLRVRVPLVLPGWMWGPGDAGPTSAGRLFLAVARGGLRAVPRAGNTLVDARDVAAALVRAAEVGESGRRYVVAGEWHGLGDLTGAIAATVGARPPRLVPARLALTAATALEAAARVRGREPVATREGVRVLLENDRVRFSSERARRELGAAFRPLESTLADEADWYRARGLLPAGSAS